MAAALAQKVEGIEKKLDSVVNLLETARGGAAAAATLRAQQQQQQEQAELIVTIESARHLPKMDMMMGTCDTLCEVEWQGQKYKTTVKKDSYSPDWNETFAFPVESISAGVSSLSVVVMDWDMLKKNDLVGEVVIPGNTLQGLLKGKHTITMEDSFVVLNKGKPVIGNDKKPCVLNLKVRLVVPAASWQRGQVFISSRL